MLRLFLKKWILFFIFTIFSLVIGIKTSVPFLFFLFWFLISVLFISLIWTALEYFAIRLSLLRELPNKIEEEENLEIKALIKNNSFFPGFNLVLEDNLPCAESQEKNKLLLIDYLGIKSFLNLNYNCFCYLRGKYDIGPFSVYFFDPFGLFFLKKTFYINSELYVYPKTFPIRKFPNLVKGVLPWFGIETTRAAGDEDEFFGVREYKAGDPIKRIHWISTARKNRLIVKQFQRQSFFRATIIFNLEKDKNFGEGKKRVAEYIIKIAASVARHLIDRDISLEIIAHSGELVHIPFNKGSMHLENIFKFLTVAQAESRVSLGEIFEEFSRYIPSDSSLIVIMLDTDWEQLPSMLLLKGRNVSIIPIVVASSSFLYPFDKQNTIRDIKTKKIAAPDLKPIFVSQGDNLEEVFKNY
jgi:uncharacterized protein (DUF58 family)